MATLNATTANPQPSPDVKVSGILDSGWGEAQAAVIVHPDAPAAALVEWSRAQLQAVNLMLDILTTVEECGVVWEPERWAGALVHLTGQAESVLAVATERLRGVKVAAESPQIQ